MADIAKELRERAAIRVSREGPFTKENLVEWRAADALDAAHKRIATLEAALTEIAAGPHLLSCDKSRWAEWAAERASQALPAPPSRIDKED